MQSIVLHVIPVPDEGVRPEPRPLLSLYQESRMFLMLRANPATPYAPLLSVCARAYIVIALELFVVDTEGLR